MTAHQDDIEFEEGSGNVFQDLGLEAPEEELSKARLAWQILRLISERDLNRTQAAVVLGIAQPKASRLLTGQTTGFSTEKLLYFLTRLDQDVRIIISRKPASSPHGRLLVQAATRAVIRGKAPRARLTKGHAKSGHRRARAKRVGAAG